MLARRTEPAQAAPLPLTGPPPRQCRGGYLPVRVPAQATGQPGLMLTPSCVMPNWLASGCRRSSVW